MTVANGGTMKFKPTDEQRMIVKLAAGCGMSEPQIARLIPPKGISIGTLRYHFENEIATGRDYMDLMVARNLFAIASTQRDRNGTAAAIFWMKSRGGWIDQPAKSAGPDESAPGDLPPPGTIVSFVIGDGPPKGATDAS